MKHLARVSLVVSLSACFSALVVNAQVYTVSAKPGAVNYIEGQVYLNDKALSDKGLRNVFLTTQDVIRTDEGKAEVLLSPGVFLRLGEHSEVRMISPTLVGTQVEVLSGEAMVEAAGLVPGNHLLVIDRGSSTSISKNGLYRFEAGDPPLVAVLQGKAQVAINERVIDLKKGRETVIAESAKVEKFNTKTADDDLYAWSNARSEYEAASSYRVASNASAGLLGGGAGGYGGNGWLWDSGFNSWAWLPGSGAFYSPFGYGFYSPGAVGYAPVVVAPIYGGGGGYWRGGHHDHDGDHKGGHDHDGDGGHHGSGHVGGMPVQTAGAGRVITAPVPVRPTNGFRDSGPHPSFGAGNMGVAAPRVMTGGNPHFGGNPGAHAGGAGPAGGHIGGGVFSGGGSAGGHMGGGGGGGAHASGGGGVRGK